MENRYARLRLNTAICLSFLSLCSCLEVNNDTIGIEAYSGEYICISLDRYFETLQAIVEKEGPVPEKINNLYGLSWLEGFLYDESLQEIILIGKTIKERPVFHAEDLIVNFHNVTDSICAPYCSLDPYPENVLRFKEQMNKMLTEGDIQTFDSHVIGGQKIVTGGVPRNSGHAKTMVFADYDLKKISQGLLEIKEIRSCLDISESLSDEINRNTFSRFWLCIDSIDDMKRPLPSFVQSNGLVLIDKCPVIVLTEEQVADEKGRLSDDKAAKNIISETFAAECSEKYSLLASENNLFAGLENLFRLQACLRAIAEAGMLQNSEKLKTIINNMTVNTEDSMPESLPGLVNYTITETKNQRRFFVVAGGVDQYLKIMPTNFRKKTSLSRLAREIKKTRPSGDAVYWETTIQVKKKGFLDHFKVKETGKVRK